MTSTAQRLTGLQLLELIADVLGHTPIDSIALLTTRRPAGITVRRIDLGADADRIADILLATLDQLPDPAGIVIAAYPSTPWADPAPHRLLRRIHDRLELAGYPANELLIQTRTGWGRAGLDEHPLPHHPNRRAEPAVVHAFQDAYRRATSRTLHRDATGPRPLAALVDEALTRPELPALAALAAAIAIPENRAPVLLQLAWGDHDAAGAVQLLAAGGHRRQTAPDARRLARAEPLLRAVSELAADRAARAGALGMLGWVLAAQGRGTAAAHAVDHALSISPDDALAVDLGSWLDAGGLPPWCSPQTGDPS